MVLRSYIVVEVANVSAELCQVIACNPQRLRREDVIYLLFCVPFQHIRRLVLSLCPFLSLSSRSGDSRYDSHSD